MDKMTTQQIGAGVGRGVFVLTGPTSGLGRALHDALRARKAPLLAVGRRMDRLAGAGAVLVEADFADPAPSLWLGDVETRLHQLLEEHPGRTLTFLNNAGMIAPIGSATGIDEQALQVAMRVNFAAPFALASKMIDVAASKGRRLRVVNITTGAARRPIAGWLAYCTSKAACKMALDVLAIENPDIELLHVDPGVIDTGMQAYIRQHAVTGHDGSADRVVTAKSPELAAVEVLSQAISALP